jgi:hypothetical protein
MGTLAWLGSIADFSEEKKAVLIDWSKAQRPQLIHWANLVAEEDRAMSELHAHLR